MNSEQDELLMSQLADGELPSDQLNELLLEVLSDTERQMRLEQILRLRNATLVWRRQKPARPMTVLAGHSFGRTRKDRRWWLETFALSVSACAVLFLMFLASTWVRGRTHDITKQNAQQTASLDPVTSSPIAQVTPEEMRQVAEVFALHESVTGPLAWYAADDQNIRLATAPGAVTSQRAIALQLKLEPVGSSLTHRILIIVCREQEPTVIELPAEFPDQASMRIYIDPQKVDGKVDVQYAIAFQVPERLVDSSVPPTVQPSLSGRRRVGLTETSLGQLAMGDQLVNVEASAWALYQDQP